MSTPPRYATRARESHETPAADFFEKLQHESEQLYMLCCCDSIKISYPEKLYVSLKCLSDDDEVEMFAQISSLNSIVDDDRV